MFHKNREKLQLMRGAAELLKTLIKSFVSDLLSMIYIVFGKSFRFAILTAAQERKRIFLGFVHIQWTQCLRVVAISADILCFNKCEPSDLLLFHRICKRHIGSMFVFFVLFVYWCTVTMPGTKTNNRHFFMTIHGFNRLFTHHICNGVFFTSTIFHALMMLCI